MNTSPTPTVTPTPTPTPSSGTPAPLTREGALGILAGIANNEGNKCAERIAALKMVAEWCGWDHDGSISSGSAGGGPGDDSDEKERKATEILQGMEAHMLEFLEEK